MRFQFSDCVLDAEGRCLLKAGEEIHVERQVFDVLFALLESADQLVTKDQLVDRVWNGRIISDGAISARIASARKAVGDDGRKQAVIKTISGVGFRFVADVVEIGPTRGKSAKLTDSTKEAGLPKLAVLPFSDRQGDAQDPLIGPGIAYEIVSMLAKVRWLFLVSANSSLTYDPNEADLQTVASELDVRYILRGSFIAHQSRVRTTSWLIDCETNQTAATFTTEGDLNSPLKAVADIATRVVGELVPEISLHEMKGLRRTDERSLSAWQMYLSGTDRLKRHSVSENLKARELLAKAIASTPDFAVAHAKLAISYLNECYYGWGTEPKNATLQMAEFHAQTARRLDPQEALGLDALASIFQYQRKHEEAEHWAREAIDLCPTCASAYATLISVLAQRGKAREALEVFDALQSVNPRDPDLSGALLGAATAQLILGAYSEAANLAQRHVVLRPNWYGSRTILAASLAYSGKLKAASNAIAQLKALVPWLTLKNYPEHSKLCRSEDVSLVLEGLRQAGMSNEISPPT